jgi:hypothetical protein
MQNRATIVVSLQERHIELNIMRGVVDLRNYKGLTNGTIVVGGQMT